MKTPFLLLALAAGLGAANPVLRSPDQRIVMGFTLLKGRLHVYLARRGESILRPSPLGLTFREGGTLGPLRITATHRRTIDETWTPVWGIASKVHHRAKELTLDLRERGGSRRQLRILARVSDDGAAFRYEVPASGRKGRLDLDSEDTELRFAQDPTSWWIPAGVFADEALHRETRLSQAGHVNTPWTLRTEGGQLVSIHEAALRHYSEMTLKRTSNGSFRVHLWPWPDGVAVKADDTLRSPWRTFQFADRPGQLLESHFLQNLNDTCALRDTTWIRPMSFLGIWWGMHTKAWTWEEGPHHGATTERTRATLDFAARHGVDAVLAEGWNKGWETWGASTPTQDFCRPANDFDLERVVQHAREKGVAFLGHHETGGNIPMYEGQMEAAFALCARLGIPSVKTGYAGPILPSGQHHHGQWMVEHFQNVVETAARHRITLNVHEGIKPTGLERTWPNLMATEGARGMEWNATLDRNPPRHDTLLPYTRFLGGPFDATTGLFNLDFAPERGLHVQSTLARQLALSIVFYSPLRMLADRIEAYEGHPAFPFLAQVPNTWDETRGLEAELGRSAAVARRRGGTWYLGAINADATQDVAFPLDFLAPGQSYVAEIHADAMDTDWRNHPSALESGRYRVTSADTLRAVLSPAGGLAVRLTPTSEADLPNLEAFHARLAPKRMRFASVAKPGDLRIHHPGVGAKVTLAATPHASYAAGHLADGRITSGGFQDPAWLGFEGVDLSATLSFETAQMLRNVALRVLHDPSNWIQVPARLLVEGSEDGRSWYPLGTLAPAQPAALEQSTLRVTFPPATLRHLRVTAAQRPLPQGHMGHGKPGFLFCDEIEVR